MKLISSILFIVMVFAVSFVYAQDTKPEKSKTVFSAKLYAVSTFQLGNVIIGNGLEISKSFSPTLTWGREYGNYNEVELTDFRFQKNVVFKSFKSGARYSYNWKVYSKSNESRFSYYLGVGAGAYFENEYNSTNIFNSEFTTYVYRSNDRNFQLYSSIIPRVNIKLGKKIFLDINLPYNFYNYSWNKRDVKYIIGSRENNTYLDNYETTFPNKFNVNVGIAIKF